ncbi:hypothetical protein CH333_10595 [candidate division WOR-3 bacterium JGI_Cruoil_03_44_89]|uniref:Secretion system C-terminal sorting domain-containing protein n=1 Tax=candidate division WOR-3 bacterium JGI_Cruoil_03_44_89 TaxID=1973748 RepID=A0A235BNP2_UNCW3|nr:MAG: hypothetical protein CH333_10595 [candidate division WOR-3 bacterium JGI_Cruoil_03_44_89]
MVNAYFGIIDSVLVIDHDTTICDNIILIEDAQLIIRDCSFFLKGDLIALQNSLFSVKNANFVIPQDFIYQFILAALDSATIEISNSRFNSANLPVNGATIDRGSFLMDSVDMDGAFITFSIYDNGSINISYSNRAGEFVVLGDSAQLSIAHSDTVLVWLGFPEGSSGELHGSFGMEDWVEEFTYPDSTCQGMNYSIGVDSIYGLMLATMVEDSTDVTIYDAQLPSSGNIFTVPICDTISGLEDESHYDDWVAPFPGRNLHLVNSSIRAWNLYFFGNTDFTLKSSIFGECLSSDSSKTTLMNTTCDGFGGHIGASGSSFFLTFFATLYTDALMEENSISMFLLTNFMFGHLIARDMAVSVIYNTILANPIQIYDSATVMVTGLYPPSSAYIDDTLSIRGSATIVRAPDSPFEFEGYRVEYAPEEDTMHFIQLNDRITEPVDDGELCKFPTFGLDIGTYIIRLWYFFSAFGTSDSLSFDNTVYLGYYGIDEGDPPRELSLSVSLNPFSSATSIYYNIPQLSELELSIYNICGQKIATLDKGTKKAGRYMTTWSARNFPDGVYLCQLKTGNDMRTRKIIKLR